ncbi:hypothetical protein J2848_005250 [Azospirillum lipoferum]|uniref:AAA family ATPase n=1 Tax=Azospirillum lipoferum TaxID=193 RepID=A0A5A9GFE4_AZOLI|nr:MULTISPECIES: TniB family NTP-binding protein [Azospirillum]KAA0593150.1 AAA family ATPase [Azospirillum lipoferum]MCP1613554.1 hypothetical protein [Azospirillum lipoferum]MDW5532318.1 TniB family NTP-binding protein [Azospirillum sp. NL1]
MVQEHAMNAVHLKEIDPIVSLETTVMPHPSLSEAKAAIARLHSRFQPAESRSLKARALLIVGGTGAGKTTALEDYRSGCPDRSLGNTISGTAIVSDAALQDADERRIIYVEAAKGTTQRALVATLLGAFGYRASDHWNTSDIITKIEFYADQMHTEMIFIDEGHHLVSGTNPEQTEDVAEFIKSLLNRTKRQVVIAGSPTLLQITRYQQLHRRLQPSVILTPYHWGTRTGRRNFLLILSNFEKLLYLPEPSGLTKHDFARRIYVATGGEIGIVSNYLSEALSRVKAENLRSIDKGLMAEIHDSWHRSYAPEQILDFDALLDDADLIEKASAGRGIDNPFLCDDSQLKGLWNKLQADRDALLASVRVGADGSRVTKLKATGRDPYTPFTRS